MLIVTGISNEKTNESTTHAILCWNSTMFYRQERVSFISSGGKLESVQEF